MGKLSPRSIHKIRLREYIGVFKLHSMRSRILPLLLAVILFSCSSPEKQTPELDPDFEKVLTAHGDWEKWIDAESFSFTLFHETNKTQENHFIDLKSRKNRIDAESFQIGNDGEKLWVSPNREAYSGRSVRFYHNLYFYFFGIPYIFTDPGVQVEKVANRTLNGISYETLQASFESGTGDSPDDIYYLLIHPETQRLEWLLYKVTYFNPENDSFNALKYEDYRDAGGLVFPRILTGYTLEGDSTGSIRYQVSFGDVLLQEEPLDKAFFEMPENGVVAED